MVKKVPTIVVCNMFACGHATASDRPPAAEEAPEPAVAAARVGQPPEGMDKTLQTTGRRPDSYDRR